MSSETHTIVVTIEFTPRDNLVALNVKDAAKYTVEEMLEEYANYKFIKGDFTVEVR